MVAVPDQRLPRRLLDLLQSTKIQSLSMYFDGNEPYLVLCHLSVDQSVAMLTVRPLRIMRKSRVVQHKLHQSPKTIISTRTRRGASQVVEKKEIFV
jgi:hypothetical protein